MQAFKKIMSNELSLSLTRLFSFDKMYIFNELLLSWTRLFSFDKLYSFTYFVCINTNNCVRRKHDRT